MAFPTAEFKTLVKSFNAFLKGRKEPLIKVVGSTVDQVKDKFTEIVVDYIEKEKAEELPDDVIEFYNTNIAVDDEEGGEEGGEEAPEEKPAPKGKKTVTKGKKGAAPAGKKGGATKPAPAKKEPKGPSVVELTVKAYLKDGIKDAPAIVAKLEKQFPGRNIASTVSSAMCVLKHVDTYSK